MRPLWRPRSDVGTGLSEGIIMYSDISCLVGLEEGGAPPKIYVGLIGSGLNFYLNMPEVNCQLEKVASEPPLLLEVFYAKFVFREW